jgi:hypothetical protein
VPECGILISTFGTFFEMSLSESFIYVSHDSNHHSSPTSPVSSQSHLCQFFKVPSLGPWSPHSLIIFIFDKRQEAGENCMMSFIACTPSIIRVSKSRRMRWVGHVALMGE